MPTVGQISSLTIGDSVDSLSVTLSSVQAGSGLALLFSTYTGPPPITLTSTAGGDTWTSDGSAQTGSPDTNGYVFAYRAENAASGTHTVLINPTNSNAYITALLVEVRNTPTSSTSDGTPSGTNGSSTAIATGNLTLAASSMLLGVCSHVDVTRTITEAYTFLAETEDAANHMPANMQSRGDSTVGALSAGAYNLSWTLGGAGYAWCAVASGWRHAGGAAPTPSVKVFTNHLGGWASGWRR